MANKIFDAFFGTPPIDPNAIFMPVFALVTLTFIITLYLAYSRNRAVMKKEVSVDYFKAMLGEQLSEKLTVISRHYANLFEAPVLFYAVIGFIYVTARVDRIMIFLAWGYVVFRFWHSIVHIGSNKVPLRFAVFFLSEVFLIALWLRFALTLYCTRCWA